MTKTLLAIACILILSSPAHSRSEKSCKLPTEASGIVKKDACGIEHCAPKDFKSYSETHPQFAVQRKCHWKSNGTHCNCVSNKGIPVREKRISDLLQNSGSVK